MGKNTYFYSVELNDIVAEEGIYDVSLSGYFTNLDAAINTAEKTLENYADDDRVIEATVYFGEYIDEKGNVFGEPNDIWCGTNKSPVESARVRADNMYSKLYVDYFVKNPKIECEYIEFKGERYKSVAIPSPLFGVGGIIRFVEESALDKVIGPGGRPCDMEARMLDEMVYGYVPEEWFGLTQREFVVTIRKNFN